MKTLLLASVALFGLVGVASDADLPRRAAHLAPAPLPVFTWTGFYAGLQVGGAWGRDRASLFLDDRTPFEFGGFGGLTGNRLTYDIDGVVGGGHVGFNYQVGPVVWGVEGDIEGSGIEGRRAVSDGPLSIAAKTEIDWLSSIRGRVGLAFDRTLFYATGGMVVGEITNTYTSTGFGAPGPDRSTFAEWGWTAGGGIEHAFTNSLSARVEYRYTQFETFENRAPLNTSGIVRHEPDFHAIRGGVSYKFFTQ